MIEVRAFRNDDPPRLADVWRTAELGPCGFQPMTSAWLEACVFSKPYFDREGLQVATAGDRVVGFAHAAFGPNADSSAIDTAIGTTMLVVVVPHERHEAIATALLERTEDYLRRRGAQTILGGGTPQVGGCYMGLYGGSDLPGILDSSPGMQDVFRRAGYHEAERIAIMRRPLAGCWWTVPMSLACYELRDEAETLLGSGTFWDLQPLATAWGVHATGLMRVDVNGGRRRQGYANYLLAEALHDLAQEGVALAETHVSEANEAAIKLFFKLGFEATGHGTVFRRP